MVIQTDGAFADGSPFTTQSVELVKSLQLVVRHLPHAPVHYGDEHREVCK